MTDPRKSTKDRLLGWASRSGIILLAGGCLLAWPLGAHAQINPFRGYKGPTLTREDLAAGQAAAMKLLNDDQAEIGKSEDWAGPASGNSGSLSVQKAFQRQGMECRQLRSMVRYKRTPTAAPRVFSLNACRTPAGEWKLM